MHANFWDLCTPYFLVLCTPDQAGLQLSKAGISPTSLSPGYAVAIHRLKMTNSSKEHLTSNSDQQQESNIESLDDVNETTSNYSEYMSSLEHLRCRIDVLDMSTQPDGEHK